MYYLLAFTEPVFIVPISKDGFKPSELISLNTDICIQEVSDKKRNDWIKVHTDNNISPLSSEPVKNVRNVWRDDFTEVMAAGCWCLTGRQPSSCAGAPGRAEPRRGVQFQGSPGALRIA